ncbi:MAG: hypothetical protein EP301_09370 [Gammaproteobacteria bacterium]|jgi:hypothetical protein|nr:MAG: hypothetical protein EP301_09370 [Gammaproteobacteria bacterium]
MAELVYSEEVLYREAPASTIHELDGVRMHGGFDDDGNYVPPRSGGRREAMDAWTAALREHGGDLFDADASLLTGARMPNVAQQALLLENGIAQPFWNSLTITGKIEARGRVLAEMTFPDLQEIIVEDISGMALGHLNKGLLVMHGIDEGGEPEKGIGGHDVMWFVARDMAMGKNAYPDVEPPETISRPEAGQRLMPELPPEYEGMLSFLMNLLMIEFRAEIGFASTQEALRNEALFVDRRVEAEEAAELVGRIREDELIHVESLRLYLGELRELTLKTVDGGTISGAELIDRFWSGLVRWATVDQPAIAAKNAYGGLKPIILAHPEGERILEAFDAISDLKEPAVSAG